MKSFLQTAAYVALCAITVSCSGDGNEEKSCEQYYLETFSGTKVFYYEDGLVSEYVFEDDTIARFSYTETNKLSSMSTSDGYGEEYYYDEADRLDYIWRNYFDGPPDSLALIYTDDDLIAEVRYYSLKILKRTEQYTYTGRNATQVIIQNVGFEPSTFLFEYDNNPVPYPLETLPFNYVFQDGSIGVNNVTRQTVIPPDGAEFVTNYEYRYNSDGYPTQLRRNNQTHTFTYTCEPTFRENWFRH